LCLSFVWFWNVDCRRPRGVTLCRSFSTVLPVCFFCCSSRRGVASCVARPTAASQAARRLDPTGAAAAFDSCSFFPPPPRAVPYPHGHTPPCSRRARAHGGCAPPTRRACRQRSRPQPTPAAAVARCKEPRRVDHPPLAAGTPCRRVVRATLQKPARAPVVRVRAARMAAWSDAAWQPPHHRGALSCVHHRQRRRVSCAWWRPHQQSTANPHTSAN